MEVQQLFIQFHTLDELPQVAARLLAFGRTEPVWLFKGEMGVGKTTLIKALCEVMGVRSTVQSPTFSIINEYQTVTGETLYHFDFYRIRREEEAYDIGTEEYLDSGNYCFIEWPGKIASLWPDTYLEVDIEQADDQSRTLRARRASGQSVAVTEQ